MHNPNGARLSELTGLPGWETPNEEILLFQYAALVPANGRIVEIGAEFGMSAGALASGAQESVELISIDLFGGELLEQHRANLREAGLIERTKQIAGDSYAVFDDWHLVLDLLYIDGDHSYSGVVRDLLYTAYVKPGGYVIFHDVAQVENPNPHPLHFEVARAVNEWAADNPEWVNVERLDSIAVYRRGGLARDEEST